jgi:hypothetical protein
MCGVEIDKRERDLLFGSAALRADVAHDVAYDTVAHHNLIAAVFEEESGAMWSGRVGLEYSSMLRMERGD